MTDVKATRQKLIQAVRKSEIWDFDSVDRCAIHEGRNLGLGWCYWEIMKNIGLPRQYSDLFFDYNFYGVDDNRYVTQELVAHALETAPFVDKDSK